MFLLMKNQEITYKNYKLGTELLKLIPSLKFNCFFDPRYVNDKSFLYSDLSDQEKLLKIEEKKKKLLSDPDLNSDLKENLDYLNKITEFSDFSEIEREKIKHFENNKITITPRNTDIKQRLSERYNKLTFIPNDLFTDSGIQTFYINKLFELESKFQKINFDNESLEKKYKLKEKLYDNLPLWHPLKILQDDLLFNLVDYLNNSE